MRVECGIAASNAHRMRKRKEWLRCVDFSEKRSVGVLSTLDDVFVKAAEN